MEMRSIGMLLVSVLLAGCCCEKKPEEVPVEVIRTSGIAPGSCADFVQNVGDRVFFEFDKSSISAESMETLRKQASWLKQYPQYTVTLVGHCDERGTTEHNLALGERRAQAAKRWLTKEGGIEASRVTTCSKGKEDPIVAGSDEEAWAKNRVSITLLFKGCAPNCGTADTEVAPQQEMSPL